ncbi:flavonol synthase/flavanone 3-hydroxylase-like [Punica granatum]|uniref:Uncharacterized protein n=2 Tax=Punica granatum TaxID=22663 RepID=A0A2I0L2Q5_PUNGR|nr:flavonol synthase/flavanone 3-hydroxylase-like [Punica granatum]PKI74968.1 hypothetical protein CRG98_004740 [Punica granatum]
MPMETVQTIASRMSQSADTIPEEYIRRDKEEPSVEAGDGPVPKIPTVDLGEADQEKLVKAVAGASGEWGIFQVVNHGIPDNLISRLQHVGREFFELPQEEKEVYAKAPDSSGIEGYGTQVQSDPRGKKSWADHLFHKIWPPSSRNYQFWPKKPTSYREVNEEYARYLRQVADKLFRSLSLGLGLEENVLKDGAGGEELQYELKINYYPPCPRPDLTFGVPAHTDLSALTILVPNEVPGLQVFQDDRWINAEYVPGALIIHIGDQIEILSNGKYRSVLHRTTVNKEKVRMSWPVFLEPPMDWVVGPLAQLVDDENPPKFKSKKFKDYMYCKLHKLPQ